MYALGMAVGLAVGFGTGYAVGKESKPWSGLTPKEKKLKLISVVLGIVTLAAGVFTFLIVKAKAA
jgi:hypothetical protein